MLSSIYAPFCTKKGVHNTERFLIFQNDEYPNARYFFGKVVRAYLVNHAPKKANASALTVNTISKTIISYGGAWRGSKTVGKV